MAQINKIGVIGAGNMGSGIVQKIAQEGINVVMIDTKDEFVQRGLGIIKGLLEEGVERKIFKPQQVEETLSRIKEQPTLTMLPMQISLLKLFLKTKR